MRPTPPERRPGARLWAGLSCLGLAATLATGCAPEADRPTTTVTTEPVPGMPPPKHESSPGAPTNEPAKVATEAPAPEPSTPSATVIAEPAEPTKPDAKVEAKPDEPKKDESK